ncbi:AMP-binding protein [Streptomyces sp. NPDC050759]|uniref:AMP-binding protein n=1 Tax=Streptomyces sp. NPDC050759 TaxID=3365635 RepID=UPI0037A171CC
MSLKLQSVLHRVEAVFGCPVTEGYGLSETSPFVTFGSVDGTRKPGSIGTPIDGVEARLIDERGKEVTQGQVGELVVREPNVTPGSPRLSACRPASPCR